MSAIGLSWMVLATMRTERSTFSIGLTLSCTTVSSSVLSKQCVEASTTCNSALSISRQPERVSCASQTISRCTRKAYRIKQIKRFCFLASMLCLGEVRRLRFREQCLAELLAPVLSNFDCGCTQRSIFVKRAELGIEHRRNLRHVTDFAASLSEC